MSELLSSVYLTNPFVQHLKSCLLRHLWGPFPICSPHLSLSSLQCKIMFLHCFGQKCSASPWIWGTSLEPRSSCFSCPLTVTRQMIILWVTPTFIITCIFLLVGLTTLTQHDELISGAVFPELAQAPNSTKLKENV